MIRIPIPRLRTAFTALVLALCSASGCGEPLDAPLARIDGLIEVQVLDDTVHVTRHPLYPRVHFAPRLRLHNRSSTLAVRWGGCAGLDLRNEDGASVLDRICTTDLRPDDRPLLRPGETIEFAAVFDVCTDLNCAPRIDVDRIDGRYRLGAMYGARIENGMTRDVGSRGVGESESNEFVMRLMP